MLYSTRLLLSLLSVSLAVWLVGATVDGELDEVFDLEYYKTVRHPSFPLDKADSSFAIVGAQLELAYYQIHQSHST